MSLSHVTVCHVRDSLCRLLYRNRGDIKLYRVKLHVQGNPRNTALYYVRLTHTGEYIRAEPCTQSLLVADKRNILKIAPV